MFKPLHCVGAAGLLLASALMTPALAQPATRRAPAGAEGGAGGGGGGGTSRQRDAQLASWLLVDNLGEIATSRLAVEVSQNDQVREFAQMMIDEHSQMVEQLEQMGAQAEGSPGLNRGPSFLELKQQIGRQSIETARNRLGRRQGADFDAAYVGMQVTKHMEMLDTLRVVSQHASPELQDMIAQGEKTTATHLQHAEQLMGALQGSNVASGDQEAGGRRLGTRTGDMDNRGRRDTGAGRLGGRAGRDADVSDGFRGTGGGTGTTGDAGAGAGSTLRGGSAAGGGGVGGRGPATGSGVGGRGPGGTTGSAGGTGIGGAGSGAAGTGTGGSGLGGSSTGSGTGAGSGLGGGSGIGSGAGGSGAGGGTSGGAGGTGGGGGTGGAGGGGAGGSGGGAGGGAGGGGGGS